MLTGSIGLLPSSSLGAGKLGLYEPIHGSAPDIAGTDTANPIATILAAAMMLSSSLGLVTETAALEKAINTILSKGYRTPDICSMGTKKRNNARHRRSRRLKRRLAFGCGNALHSRGRNGRYHSRRKSRRAHPRGRARRLHRKRDEKVVIFLLYRYHRKYRYRRCLYCR